MKIKAKFGIIVGSIVIFSSLLLPSALASSAFNDVPMSHPFHDYIKHLKDASIVSGTAGKYFPDNFITRGELTKIVVNAAEIDTTGISGTTFSDVSTSNSFYKYIEVAAKSGIVNGFQDGTFKPNDPVTRGAAMKIVVNAFNYATDLSGAPHFSDVPTTYNFYQYIETGYNNGLASGYPNNTFKPNDQIIRSHMAKIVSNALGGPNNFNPVEVPGDIIMSFNYTGFPTGKANIDRLDPDEFNLQAFSMDPLPSGFMYQIWAEYNGETINVGRFNVDQNNNLIDKNGNRQYGGFSLDGIDVKDLDNLWVSIEDNDDEHPSPMIILQGQFPIFDDTVYMDFPPVYPGWDGKASISGLGKDKVSFIFNDLPSLQPYGFTYEGWIIKADGNEESLGKFDSNKSGLFSHVAVHYEDATEDTYQILVSIEPIYDYSVNRSKMKPFTSASALFANSVVSEDNNTSIVIDPDVYLGLTTAQTSSSIIARMTNNIDEDEEVIVQVYAGAPVVNKDETVAIIVKVSDLDGEPILDLDLEMEQMSGISGESDDPSEEGSGIYIGSWTAPEEVSGSNSEITLRINGDDIPATNVEFEVKSSSLTSDPDEIEVDITRETVIWDENDDNDDDEIYIILPVLDSRGKAVPDMSSEISISALSGNLDGASSVSEADNTYFYALDIEDDLLPDNLPSSDTTYRSEMRFKLIDTSGAYIPIISDNYWVEIEFIPEED